MQSELFDRSVNEALNNVVAKVTKHDALNFLNVKAREGHTGQALNTNSFGVNRDNTPPKIVKKKQTARERKIALLRDSLRRMIMHKKMDDELTKLMQGGTVNLQIRLEEFTDEFGDVHGRGCSCDLRFFRVNLL